MFVEKDNRLFIVDRLDAPVREGAIAVVDQDAVAGDPSGPFVPILEGLDIGNEQDGEQRLLKDQRPEVDHLAEIIKGYYF